jgi:hypothetical protein
MTAAKEHDAFLNFIKLNAALWATEDALLPRSTGAPTIFVDLLSHDLQIYGTRALYIAKLLQKRYGCRPVGIIGNLIFSRDLGFSYSKADAVKLARSFGLRDFIDLEDNDGTFVGEGYYDRTDTEQTIQAIRGCRDEDLSALLLDLRTPEGCRVGEYIYETVIRITRDPFVTNTRDKVEEVIRETFRVHNLIRDFCRDTPVETFVTGHLSYTQWGMIADLVLRHGGKALWFDCEGHFSAYLLDRPPVGSETLDGLVRKIEAKLFEREFQQRHAIDQHFVEKIRLLFTGNYFVRPFWFEPAKKPPAELTADLRRMALRTLGWLDDSRPVICVFFHCFSDLPRDDEQVYLDYYVWVVETLKIAVKDTSKNWIFKAHPWNRGVYDVTNTTDRLKEEYKDHQHIYFLEDELQKMEVFAVCDLAVTVRGSIAYEMSVFGRPALAAGRSVRSDLGFCHVANNAQEYEDLLTRRFQTLTLTNDMQERANFYLIYDKVICRVESTFLPFWTYQLTGGSEIWDAMTDRILYNISDLDPAAEAIYAMYDGDVRRTINPRVGDLTKRRRSADIAPPSVASRGAGASVIQIGQSVSFGFEGTAASILLAKPSRTDQDGSWFNAGQEAFVGFVLRSTEPVAGAKIGLELQISSLARGRFLNVAINGLAPLIVPLRDEEAHIERVDTNLRVTSREHPVVMRIWLTATGLGKIEFRLDSIKFDTLRPPSPSRTGPMGRLLARFSQ